MIEDVGSTAEYWALFRHGTAVEPVVSRLSDLVLGADMSLLRCPWKRPGVVQTS